MSLLTVKEPNLESLYIQRYFFQACMTVYIIGCSSYTDRTLVPLVLRQAINIPHLVKESTSQLLLLYQLTKYFCKMIFKTLFWWLKAGKPIQWKSVFSVRVGALCTVQFVTSQVAAFQEWRVQCLGQFTSIVLYILFKYTEVYRIAWSCYYSECFFFWFGFLSF